MVIVGGIFAVLALLMVSMAMQMNNLGGHEEVENLHGKMRDLETKLQQLQLPRDNYSTAHDELLETNTQLRQLYNMAQQVIDKLHENEEAVGISAGGRMSLPGLPIIAPTSEEGLHAEVILIPNDSSLYT